MDLHEISDGLPVAPQPIPDRPLLDPPQIHTGSRDGSPLNMHLLDTYRTTMPWFDRNFNTQKP